MTNLGDPKAIAFFQEATRRASATAITVSLMPAARAVRVDVLQALRSE